MSNLQNLPISSGPVSIDGAVSLQSTDEGIQPWRLVHDRIKLFEPTLRGRASAPAGVRISLVSDTDMLEVDVDSPTCEQQFIPETWTFDLTVDGTLHQRIEKPLGQGDLKFTDIPAGEHCLEVWLDLAAPVRLKAVRIADGASAKPFIDTRPKWTVYGSSITHSRSAHGPTETWPALIAARFGLNLTCLGYGGNCHMEPMVAKIIRDIPADYISMCLGINVQGNGSLNGRTFRAAVIGMIETARETHPDAPMAIVSPIYNPPREATPNAAEMTLQRMRGYIAEACNIYREAGDVNLHYVDGLDLFGFDYLHHMPDKLHPDADGNHALAECYGRVVMQKFNLTPRQAITT